MEEDNISYQNLRKIQQLEKSSPVLTNLRSSFYIELFEYLEDLNKKLEKESTSQKQILLKDEIKNIEKIAISIYEQREKKILLATVTMVRGGSPDLKNFLDDEKNLYDCVLNNLQESRIHIMGKKEKKNDSSSLINRTEVNNEKKNEGNPINTNPIILVTENIPEFIGTDTNKYCLRKDDVVSMPENMSEMLLKRNVIKKIKR